MELLKVGKEKRALKVLKSKLGAPLPHALTPLDLARTHRTRRTHCTSQTSSPLPVHPHLRGADAKATLTALSAVSFAPAQARTSARSPSERKCRRPCVLSA
uniref:Uncharacterized protein n=1 Tax=Chrysotila carterae TaxID=13221 RepID=A0A6S9RT93_CHRCT